MFNCVPCTVQSEYRLNNRDNRIISHYNEAVLNISPT